MIDTLLLIQSYSHPSFLVRTNHKLLSQLCFVFISLLCHLAYHVPSKVDKQALTLPSPRVAILTKLSEGRVTSVLQPSPGNLVVRFRSSSIISRYCVSPPKLPSLVRRRSFCFCSLHNTTFTRNCHAKRLTFRLQWTTLSN